jgi:hypothetical protein
MKPTQVLRDKHENSYLNLRIMYLKIKLVFLQSRIKWYTICLTVIQTLKKNVMKLIKTTLVALTVIIGFSSNAQETRKNSGIKQTGTLKTTNLNELAKTPEQIATERAVELKSKVELTDEQFTSVKDLFLKTENRKAALTNVSEEEKAKEIANLKTNEEKALNAILTPTQQKTISAPKTAKSATNM